MGTVVVEVAVRDDRRLLDALASLDQQERRPDRVLVAASPTTPRELLDAAHQSFPSLSVVCRQFPGGVVDARAASLADLQGSVTAFLDSDERAPPEWLARLVEPIERGLADFTGGPTRALRPPRNATGRYTVLLEEAIYADLVPRSVTYLPLQNTAWKTDALRELGFDTRIPYAEDHDLETRAARAGLVGAFVPEAWVYHDASADASFVRWARKRYRYLVAMAMSLMKNGELGRRLGERRRPVAHPLRFVEASMKPIALVHAWVRWHRVSRAADRAVVPKGPAPSPPAH